MYSSRNVKRYLSNTSTERHGYATNSQAKTNLYEQFLITQIGMPWLRIGSTVRRLSFAITTGKKGTDFGKTKDVQILRVQLGSGQQPSHQSCYYRLMFSKYIVRLWFTQYTGPAQVTQ
jgi:hypothetical protein